MIAWNELKNIIQDYAYGLNTDTFFSLFLSFLDQMELKSQYGLCFVNIRFFWSFRYSRAWSFVHSSNIWLHPSPIFSYISTVVFLF